MPLSFAQQRLWFIEQLAPGGFAYNVPWFARLTGPLDVAALGRSLRALVQRHEALRTTFPQVDGRPVQRIAPELGLTLPVEGLEDVPREAREAAARRLAEEEARCPFDLERGPLVRARLLRLSAEEHVLLLTLHHLVCDGWTMGLLERELSALYTAFSRGEEPSLPALPVQYADYAVWQREWLKGEVLEEQLAWWTRQLAGAPPVLELPADKPRPPAQSSRGALLSVGLPPKLSGAMAALSRAEGVTPFMTFLAAFHALLSRYSGQTDLVVGTPIAGRNRRELEGVVGFFANTLALRVDAPEEGSFREMGRRLSAEGHAVPLCALLDAPGPGHFPPPPEDDAALLAGMVASWVDIPAGALRGLPAEAQLQAVLDEAARRGLEPAFPDVGQGLRFLRVWRSHAEALHRYTAPRWEGGALQFFRAAELQPGRPELLGLDWTDRCSAVRVEVVPGDHDSMLLPPHVDSLAARIRACLARAQAG